MTPAEAVVMDWLLERGYTREQAARALVALTLSEPTLFEATSWRDFAHHHADKFGSVVDTGSAWLQAEAERRGYLPKP